MTEGSGMVEIKLPGHLAVPQHNRTIILSTRRRIKALLVLSAVLMAFSMLYHLSMGIVSILTFGFFVYLIFAAFFLDRTTIGMSKESIRFPWFFIPTLKGRLEVPWGEIDSINLIDGKEATGHQIRFTLSNGRFAQFGLIRLGEEELKSMLEVLSKVDLPPGSPPDLLENIEKWWEFEHNNSQAYMRLKTNNMDLPPELSLELFEHLKAGDEFVLPPHRVASVLAAGGVTASYLCDCRKRAPHIVKQYWLGWLDEGKRARVLAEISGALDKLKDGAPELQSTPKDIWSDEESLFVEIAPAGRESLRKIIRKGKIKPPVVKETLLRLAGHLDALHRAGSFHGAIEPDSVSLSRAGEPSLSEPPLVRAMIGYHADRLLVSRSTYRAPELLVGKGSPASDSYSLGKLAYFLIQQSDPEARIDLPPGTTSGDMHLIEELIHACTREDPQRRPDMRAIVDWLEGRAHHLEAAPLAITDQETGNP
ncbi:MAG: hypothetical protein KC777_14120 [Cyanobacteria bacterium HKST-UBA02]|nr:hypothetical protein [Cyanobacteria bacterium HKST-UBA02]